MAKNGFENPEDAAGFDEELRRQQAEAQKRAPRAVDRVPVPSQEERLGADFGPMLARARSDNAILASQRAATGVVLGPQKPEIPMNPAAEQWYEQLRAKSLPRNPDVVQFRGPAVATYAGGTRIMDTGTGQTRSFAGAGLPRSGTVAVGGTGEPVESQNEPGTLPSKPGDQVVSGTTGTGAGKGLVRTGARYDPRTAMALAYIQRAGQGESLESAGIRNTMGALQARGQGGYTVGRGGKAWRKGGGGGGYNFQASGSASAPVTGSQDAQKLTDAFGTVLRAEFGSQPPAATLDEYNQRWDDLKATMGPALHGIAPAVKQAYEAGMPPAVQKEYANWQMTEDAKAKAEAASAADRIKAVAADEIEAQLAGGKRTRMAADVTARETAAHEAARVAAEKNLPFEEKRTKALARGGVLSKAEAEEEVEAGTMGQAKRARELATRKKEREQEFDYQKRLTEMHESINRGGFTPKQATQLSMAESEYQKAQTDYEEAEKAYRDVVKEKDEKGVRKANVASPEEKQEAERIRNDTSAARDAARDYLDKSMTEAGIAAPKRPALSKTKVPILSQDQTIAKAKYEKTLAEANEEYPDGNIPQSSWGVSKNDLDEAWAATGLPKGDAPHAYQYRPAPAPKAVAPTAPPRAPVWEPHPLGGAMPAGVTLDSHIDAYVGGGIDADQFRAGNVHGTWTEEQAKRAMWARVAEGTITEKQARQIVDEQGW